MYINNIHMKNVYIIYIIERAKVIFNLVWVILWDGLSVFARWLNKFQLKFCFKFALKLTVKLDAAFKLEG